MHEIKPNKGIFPVDIVMVTWNRPKLTARAIAGIGQNTKNKNYRLIVIDNGSEPDMVKSLKVLASKEAGLIDELVLNDTNRGLEPARNQGLALVKSPYFICADNDCLPPKPTYFKSKIIGGQDKTTDWIEAMVELMEKNPEYAALSLRTDPMIGTGNIFEKADERGDDIVEFEWPGGSYRIMSLAATLDAGGWRDDMPGRGSEERWICGRLRELGWKTGFTAKLRTLHLYGDKDTDNWGYDKEMKPEDSGHSPGVWHPKFESKDDPDEIKEYLR